VKVGDKVMIKGRTGDLDGLYTIIDICEDRVIVKHPDYSGKFIVKKSECIKTLNKK